LSQQPGLRFDIYERIMLNEEAEPIRELNGVELIPQIEVVVEGEQAVVRGYLQLQGAYASEDETRSSVALEHTIPVEITLPMNRVSSVEQISVEIDNFDVDLLSARSLNVTGVLSLHGIEMYSNSPVQDWREEEEIVFVHQAEPDATALQQEEEEESEALQQAAAPWLLQIPAAYESREENEALMEPPPIEEPEENEAVAENESMDDNEAQQVTYASPVQPAVYQSLEAHQNEKVEVKPREEILVDTYEDLTLLDHYESTEEQDNEDNNSAWTTEQTVSHTDEAQEDEEDRDKEMKIAFGSKRSEESQSSEFRSYLHKNDSYRKPANSTQSRYDDNRLASEEQSPADALEWKKLFLSESEEQKFKKVKMVIVQKEETLDAIARRYDRKPQEIKLYNRLQELDVSAGQVIYIP
jgi:stage VI sporulation protein D